MMETPKEEKLIAAVRFIMMELKSNKRLSDETIKILEDLCVLLTSLVKITETKDENEELSDIKRQFKSIQDKVMTWEVGQSMKWISRTNDEVKRLITRLESFNPIKGSEEHELLRKANDVLQISMARIEEEFKYMLVHNRQNFEPAHLSFRSADGDMLDDSSRFSFDDDSVDDSNIQRDIISQGSEIYFMDPINPQIIPDLKHIASSMFDSNYNKECCQAFISVRKDALDDFLHVHMVEKMSIADILKMEWATLNFKIRNWTKALKIFVRVYLASEKLLCEQIFGQTELASSFCFFESSKDSILQILNFAEAIAVVPHQPEKLPRILDMYEVLVDLTRDIEFLYPDDNGLYLKTEFHDVLMQVANCATSTFHEFKNVVGSNVSNVIVPSGGIHHLTRYVMNYLKTLTEYSNPLNYLLKDDGDSLSLLDASCAYDVDDSINQNSCLAPTRLHFESLMSTLESNLKEKSRLYKEEALGHLFLMNNIHFMVKKVKGSELRTMLGDSWIRKHNWRFQQQALGYERSTWRPILNLLKVEGIHIGNSDSLSKMVKERLLSFNTRFEEIYKCQTGWLVPDGQLCEDLRISISLKVIQAYRTFVGKFANRISVRYVKYSADDLENYLLDFFQGSSRSLPK
ncbi:hypothetical protein E3N88_01759 [Mikania micrantha]|uniref:Exocyst subunit Exo70 family protein n=1 Tax=Mikania micrantha TaxID=192012 RepID=A0A5N6Q2G6_9ASTR|nr:hypothetical protein E3N88_01759 [Mikania micrantha]